MRDSGRFVLARSIGDEDGDPGKVARVAILAHEVLRARGAGMLAAVDTRKVASCAVMVGFMAMNAGTSKPRPAGLDGAATAAAATSATTTATATAATTPPDVDVGAMRTTLACGAKATLAGCKLLDDFDGADEWRDVPTADTVFYGETNGIGGAGDGQKEFFFLQVEAVPGSIQGAARTLIPETPKEKDDCTKLLAATRAGNALAGSPAVTFMRGRPPGKHTVVKSAGKSQTLSGTHVFMRRKGDRVLIVEYLNGVALGHGGKTNVQANGWVAELFLLR
jgi:hypothetical protein